MAGGKRSVTETPTAGQKVHVSEQQTHHNQVGCSQMQLKYAGIVQKAIMYHNSSLVSLRAVDENGLLEQTLIRAQDTRYKDLLYLFTRICCMHRCPVMCSTPACVPSLQGSSVVKQKYADTGW